MKPMANDGHMYVFCSSYKGSMAGKTCFSLCLQERNGLPHPAEKRSSSAWPPTEKDNRIEDCMDGPAVGADQDPDKGVQGTI